MPRLPVTARAGIRVQQWIAHALDALPPAAQVQLSGRPPVELDGDTLDPATQLALAMLERRREPPPETLTPAQARLARRRLSAVYAGKPTPVGAVSDLQLEHDGAGPTRARHYAPRELGEPHPLLVYYHGGGFTYGDLDTHDGLCRILCRHAGAHVLAVDYRLAPEDPFPAAVDDARTALRWAFAHAADLGADPRRIGVGGDSAGGNLAAVVSQLAGRDGGPPPVLQLLIYGFHELTEAGIFANSEALHWATEPYGPDGVYGQYLSYMLVILPLGWLTISSLRGTGSSTK